MELPVELYQKIVEVLSSLPQIHDSRTQQALMHSAGLDSQLQKQIVFGGSTSQFVQESIVILNQYGILQDGRLALVAALEAAKKYVGQDKQSDIDTLIQEVHKLHEKTAKKIFIRPDNKAYYDFLRQKLQKIQKSSFVVKHNIRIYRYLFATLLMFLLLWTNTFDLLSIDTKINSLTMKFGDSIFKKRALSEQIAMVVIEDKNFLH